MVIKIHNPFDNHPEGLFAIITKEFAVAHDWMAGPPMTKRDRVNRNLDENHRFEYIGPMGMGY